MDHHTGQQAAKLSTRLVAREVAAEYVQDHKRLIVATDIAISDEMQEQFPANTFSIQM